MEFGDDGVAESGRKWRGNDSLTKSKMFWRSGGRNGRGMGEEWARLCESFELDWVGLGWVYSCNVAVTERRRAIGGDVEMIL
jgi:hypothetical protein